MLVSRSGNKVLSETFVLVEREKDERKDIVNPVEILIKRNNGWFGGERNVGDVSEQRIGKNSEGCLSRSL